MSKQTENNHRANLHSNLWKVAHELRGTIDGWDFKNCTLSVLTYLHLSHRFSTMMQGRGFVTKPYWEVTEEIPDNIKAEATRNFGFFLAPHQTYQRVITSTTDTGELNTYQALKDAFNAIQHTNPTLPEETLETSTSAYRGLFNTSIDFFSRMAEEEGLTPETLSLRIRGILTTLEDTINTESIDSFGDAYEFLMGMYASEAGKSGGEYFTPQSVSAILTRITSAQNPAFGTAGRYSEETPDRPYPTVKVYDPTCGSGSLLLNFAKLAGNQETRYYGQEKSNTTYNFARMNMLMHEVEPDQFSIQQGDTLANPKKHDGLAIQEQEGMFDAIVSNPPYSVHWNPNQVSDDDPRFVHGRAPASYADLAFTQHILYCLKDTGTAAIVEFPGILYRGGAEKDIRKSLLEANVVDAVIRLPEGVFYGTGIPTCLLILRKDRGEENQVLFMDATPYKLKQAGGSILAPEHQNLIVEGYVGKENIPHFVRLVDKDEIKENGYDLSPESYVTAPVVSEEVNIQEIEKELESLQQASVLLSESIEEAKVALSADAVR